MPRILFEACDLVYLSNFKLVHPDMRQAENPESVFATLVASAACKLEMAQLLASLYILKNGFNVLE